MNNEKIVIALAANIQYSEQVITLIKSICYHKHKVKIYLFNRNYPKEWFDSINFYLNQIESEIIHVQVLMDFTEIRNIQVSNQNHDTSHITEETFYRYLISSLPEDKVLYLDSDIVINGDLKPFYNRSFENKLAIAVPDLFLTQVEHYYKEFPNMKPYFNAGVILINNKKWKELDLQSHLIHYTKELDSVIYADQDILNIVLLNNWIIEDTKYNFQSGAYLGLKNTLKYNKNNPEPIIIHYTSKIKPWLNVENTPYREKYWFYYRLEWNEIIHSY